MHTKPQHKKRLKGIYLLPNLFTTGALFAGFYAIIAAMKGQFAIACMVIFIAMILDGLDGRVARLTNTQSDFGAEYDSLADMVSFGIAPALIMYAWVLTDLGKPGWIAAFIYCVGAALRLARFNTSPSSDNKRYFLGLASPAAAGFLSAFVWLCVDNGIVADQVQWLAFVLTIAAGVLMVSNILYRSFKDLNLKNKVPFVAVLFVVLVFVFITLQPPLFLFLIFSSYAFSGLFVFVWRLLLKKRQPGK